MPKILHPLNHSLLAITHEFLRWLFFTISVFTDIFQNNFLLQNCPWCSLHVSRCLIYKVHRCFCSLLKKLPAISSDELLHRGASFTLYHAGFPLSTLFSTFFKSFSVSTVFPNALRYSNRDLSVCQHFFKIFLIFFPFRNG